jgi:zinc transporter ZupT
VVEKIVNTDLVIAIISVFILSAIHPASAALASKGLIRKRTVSFCAGIALAYLFIHLLPELSKLQSDLLDIKGRSRHFQWFEEHVYIIALAGLLFFQIVDNIGRNKESKKYTFSFRIETIFFALYSALISYLIIKTVEFNQPTILITIAFLAHFFGTDIDLTERYEKAFAKRGCYTLSIATIAGMVMAIVSPVSEIVYISIFSFLAGGILINTLRTELPEPQKVKSAFLLLGTIIYTILILLIYYITRR